MTRKLHGAAALVAMASFVAACSSDGPTQPEFEPAFDHTPGPVTLQVCKVAVEEDDVTTDNEVLGDTYDFEYTVNGGAAHTFSLTADVFQSDDCNQNENLELIQVSEGDVVVITELQTNPNSLLWLIANTGGEVPCVADNPGGTLVNDGTTAGFIQFTVSAANCAEGGKVFFKNTGEEPPDEGTEGCTPGYWRQPHHFDSWVNYVPGDDFDATFGVNVFNPDITLGTAVALGGGGLNALARHAVAALLNAASPDVDYPLSEAEVIAAVQAAVAAGGAAVETLKNQLDTWNNLGCPLN